MKIIACQQNHFYDADKYSACPVCNPNSAIKSEVYTAQPFSERTEKLFTTESRSGVSVNQQVSRDISQNKNVDYVENSRQILSQEPVSSKKENESLADLIKKTGRIENVDDDAKTMSVYGSREPVVGWLVCTNGCYFGESFLIKTGQNYIGRSSIMDIALIQEASISRNKHANIIFDPKSRQFFLQKGEESGLVYLNNELVLETKKLSERDKIQIGDLNFIFVPFCGELFSWEDYVK